jgi:hypothetical protein
MSRNAYRLAALVTALTVALLPSLASGPAVADDGETILVPPDEEPKGEELNGIAGKLVRDPMGRELHLAVERFSQFQPTPLNTSVAFFSFGWMQESDELPDWVEDRYRDFMAELAQEIRSPSTAPKWKYPLDVHMLNSENYFLDDLFGQLGEHPVDGWGNEQVLQLATGSVTRDGHSEIGMNEWVSRNIRAVLKRIANESQQSQIPAVLETFKAKAGAGIAGQRTLCKDCKRKIQENEGYSFRKQLYVVEYDKRGTDKAKKANRVLNALKPKVEPAYEVWEKGALDDAVKKVGLALPCQPGNKGSAMNLAAQPLSAPCAEGGSGLAQALASPSYGGVDFSSLQLRYLSDDPGSRVQYAFSAKAAQEGSAQDSRTGRSALVDSMAGLRTWLALSPDKFWVNLNPDEPDRVIDPQLGRTNAGRALLEADWQMKQTEGKLLDPKTEFGAEYWRRLGADSGGEICYSSRMWIVPGEVEVHEDGSSLYVLKADLDVKAKAEQVSGLGGPDCNADPQNTARNERLEQEMVVPKIVEAVNTAPEYAPLRQAFLARVVAQWIRDRHAAGHTTSFDKLIDSGDLGLATTAGTWRPEQVYDRYLRSIREGDFTYERTTQVGDTLVTYRMTTGGVDFGKLSPRKVSATDMDQRVPGLPEAVRKSAGQPAKAADGSLWMGETAAAPPVSTWDSVRSFFSGRTGILALLLVALGVVLFFIRDGFALRRKSAG